ncbi:MAG: hypothetical protein ACRC11_03520 [Xenococcaceae cyanobacterium]
MFERSPYGSLAHQSPDAIGKDYHKGLPATQLNYRSANLTPWPIYTLNSSANVIAGLFSA